MQKHKGILLGAAIICCIPFLGNSQDLLHMADSIQNQNSAPPPLPSTWKDTKLINAQDSRTVAPGTMVFRIQHRFGNAGEQSGGGIHTLYGFDVVSDIYMSFEFGILKNLEVGVGRSKYQELLDASFKYRPLTQKSKGMPISMAIYGDASITPELNSVFYNDADPNKLVESPIMDKISYDGEILIDRRFGAGLSFEIFAGYNHRNYVLGLVNPGNNTTDENNIPYAGAAAKIALTKRSSIILEGYYLQSMYRTNNSNLGFYQPISIGYEVETGGHVFEINFSNANYIDVNNFIPNTTDNWAKGGFKLGFSISRLFTI